LRLRLYHVLRFRCCDALNGAAGATAAIEALKSLDAR
jgi:hypothetical protein